MAYSMFECPKLHNAKSLKFYPEEYDHHVSFRHKNLPPDFELTAENYGHQTKHVREDEKTNYSVEVQTSTHKKCPIYVHSFAKVHHNDGDFIPKNRKKSKNSHKAVIEKLEETYWANWKPDKSGLKKCNTPPIPKKSKTPEIQVIKSAPGRRRKIRLHPQEEDNISRDEQEIPNDKIKKIFSRSQEIQTDNFSSIPSSPKLEESPISIIEEPIEEPVEEIPEAEPSDEAIDDKFLKHTDSFILNVKKQQEEKEHFDQPKCIRLYKKPGRMSSKNFIKGGSYPLKSCLKKDSSFGRGSNRLARPGSPIIVSSSFSTKGKYAKTRH